MKRKHKKSSRKFPFIIFSIAATIGLSFLFLNLKKSVPPETNTLSYQVGNFFITVPRNEIYLKSTNDSFGKPSTSNIKPGSCTRVTGISSLYLEKSSPIPDNKIYYSRQLRYYTSWDSNSLTFDTQANKAIGLGEINGLENLSEFTSPEVLLAHDLSPQTDNKTLDLHPWDDLIYCGGIYSIPFNIEKIDIPGYDLAYYAEVSVGNGANYNIPNHTLILKKNNNWLVTKDDRLRPFTSYSWPGCQKVDELSATVLKCIINLWNTKYYSKAESQKWIDSSIASIQYKPLGNN